MHEVWGEDGMSEKKSEGPYSLNDVEKCINNAFRLYRDAQNASTPTKAALIEIGIEELSKGIILLASIPKPDFDDSTLNYLTWISSDSTFSPSLVPLAKYNFSNFNKSNHKTKLKALDAIFQSISFMYTYLEKVLPILQDLLNPNFEQLGNIEKSDLDNIASHLGNFDLKDLDKIKQKGFYVDFKDNKSISPEEENLKTENITMIFFVLYASLNALVEIYKKTPLKKIFLDPKLMIRGFYEYLPETAKSTFRDDSK